MHDFFENSLFAGVTLSLISYLIGSILKKNSNWEYLIRC